MIEATVLDEMLPQLATEAGDNPAPTALRQRVAELIRLKEADQERLSNLIDALAEDGSKAIVQRISELEVSIEHNQHQRPSRPPAA